jgi:crossover junction endonuclease MUS81
MSIDFVLTTIDNRENKLISYLEKKSIDFKIEQLLLGDIQIQINKTDSPDTNEFIDYVIERKTIKDLLASVKDGRYKEQKLRVVSQIQQNKVGTFFYIIEGSSIHLKPYEKTIYQGCLISIQLRDNIKIFTTNNVDETGDLITRLMTRIKKGDLIQHIPSELHQTTNTVQKSYLDVIKQEKKANIDPKTTQILALSNIPGISKTIGSIVIDKYTSLADLFDIYQGLETEQEKESLLKDLQLNEKRKIGLVSSKKIYDYLFKV